MAPRFAAAFATRDSWQTLLFGLAAALGAGISMGFAEALSDNGSLTGRGSPLMRAIVCGAMTALGGPRAALRDPRFPHRRYARHPDDGA